MKGSGRALVGAVQCRDGGCNGEFEHLSCVYTKPRPLIIGSENECRAQTASMHCVQGHFRFNGP